MKVIENVRLGLNSLFNGLANLMSVFDPSPLESRLANLGYEIKDLNREAKKNNLPIHIFQKDRDGADLNQDRVRVIIEVATNTDKYKMADKYPSFRKILVDVDLSTDDTLERSLGKLDAAFFREARKINPKFRQREGELMAGAESSATLKDGPQ